MKKILILGSRGMAGHVAVHYLKDTGKYIVRQVAKGAVQDSDIYQVDVSRLNDLEDVFLDFNPDVVVNCIGILNKEAEDNPDKAVFINSFIPHYLAKSSKVHGFKLIHISTDCVFSGKKGEYTETDFKDGIGFYAQTKALGEVNYGNNLTIRTSIIGPELKINGIGLMHWFLRNESPEIKGYKKAFWGGVTTLQLAYAIERSIENDRLVGLVHLTNGSKISKFDLLHIFKNIFGKSIVINAETEYAVDKSLLKGQLTDLFGEIPGYEEMIIQLKAWMDKKRNLYSGVYLF